MTINILFRHRYRALLLLFFSFVVKPPSFFLPRYVTVWLSTFVVPASAVNILCKPLMYCI